MSGIIGTSHSKSKVIGRSQDTAKAWVNFNGSGTLALRDSFGVSSVTDNGTGDYTVNFLKALGNANFCVAGLAAETGTGYKNVHIDRTSPLATGSARIQLIASDSDAYADSEFVTVLVFGD